MYLLTLYSSPQAVLLGKIKQNPAHLFKSVAKELRTLATEFQGENKQDSIWSKLGEVRSGFQNVKHIQENDETKQQS
jgi:hypothetical protein